MEAFTTHTGRAVPLRRTNVDTDQIIPAHWLKKVTRNGFEDGLFEAWRKDDAFILTAPPTVPGMLIPNSRPASPQPAALAAADGRRAPAPQTTLDPSRAIAASSRSSLITRPLTPWSETSRFDPEPTTLTSMPSAAAQARSLLSSA